MCFKLHPELRDLKAKKVVSAFTQDPEQVFVVQYDESSIKLDQSSQVKNSPIITHEMYQQLVNLLNKQSLENNNAGDSSAMFVGSCSEFVSSLVRHKWIIDGGASNHITPHLSLF